MNDNFTNTLITADFINKYNLKTVQKKPKLNKIIVYFSMSKIEFFSKAQFKNNDVNIQIKTFLFFFFFFAKVPKLNFKKAYSSLKNNYAFKIIFSSQSDLNSYLTYLFIENSATFKEKKISLNILKNKKKLRKCLVINQTLKSQGLQTVEYSFKSIFKEFKIKNFNFNTSFIFSNGVCKTDSFMPNFVLFWVQELH